MKELEKRSKSPDLLDDDLAQVDKPFIYLYFRIKKYF